MRLSLIVAAADHGVIGRDNDLPWHLPRDLRRFRALTMGHHLIVGRKTFEAIGKALPGRTMIVLSRGGADLPDSVLEVASIEQAIDVARNAGDDEAFVAGGEQVYELALGLADRIYLTRVYAPIEGDAHFPEIDHDDWIEIAREHYPVSDANSLAVTFFVLERRTA